MALDTPAELVRACSHAGCYLSLLPYGCYSCNVYMVGCSQSGMSNQQFADYSIFSDLLGISELGSHGTMVTKLSPGNMSCGVPYSCVAAALPAQHHHCASHSWNSKCTTSQLGHISHYHPRNSTIYICPYLRDEQSHTTAVYGVHDTHMAQNTIGGSNDEAALLQVTKHSVSAPEMCWHHNTCLVLLQRHRCSQEHTLLLGAV